MNANITISRLKHHADMSEETYCFSCNVLVDGKVKYIAKNDGHGGETRLEYAKPTTVWNHAELDSLVQTVDNLVHEAIMEKSKEKDKKAVTRKLSKALFFRVKGQKPDSYYFIKTPTPNDALVRDRAFKKHDIDVIINDLPINEAVNYFFKY